MASASVVYPDEVLLTTSGKSYFTRLTRLLICGGTKVLRELFDSMNPSIHAFLTANKGRLQQMRKKRVLTSPQWKSLFSTNTTCGKSTDFDITLIFKLLREFCSLTAPAKGWDELPDDRDLTIPADLARIKYYRNDVYAAHVKMELSETDFQDLWTRIKDALLRIVTHYDPSAVLGWEEAIEKLLTDPLSEEAQEYEEVLEEWYLQDQDVKKMISNATDDIRKDIRDLKAQLNPSSPAKEEEKLPEEFETKMRIEQKSKFQIFDGDVLEDGENRVQAHLAVITSKDQVEQVLAELMKKKDPDVAEAMHNIWAYRIFNTERNAFEENCDDDGDDSSGARVLRFLQRTQATDVMVVVSCWYETTAEDFGEVRLTYIQKSVLDLLLTSGIEIRTSKLKKYFEEIKYTPFEKAKEQETPKFSILHGETIEDRKSTFQAHLADITSRKQVDQVLDELKKDRKIGKATYNMWACRVYDEKKKSYFEEREDDGENLGGERLLHLLQRSDAKNVVIIVTRWHGGIHLGIDRFKHINKCAGDLLEQRRPTAEVSTSTASTDPKAATKKKKSKKHK